MNMTPPIRNELDELTKFINALHDQFEDRAKEINSSSQSLTPDKVRHAEGEMVFRIAFATGLTLGASSVLEVLSGKTALTAAENIHKQLANMRATS